MADISKINVNSTTYNLKDSRLPDLNSSTTQYLRGDGTWATPTVQTMSGNVDVSDEGSYLLIEPGSGGGGGGGSNWTLLASEEFTVNTTSTSAKSVGSIELSLSDYADPQTVLWVHIRDKAGKRAGYYYGSDSIMFHYMLANNNISTLTTRPLMVFGYNSSNQYSAATSAYGVYSYSLNYTESNHSIKIYSKYNSTYGTINGTYKCDVYKLTMPSGVTLFT